MMTRRSGASDKTNLWELDGKAPAALYRRSRRAFNWSGEEVTPHDDSAILLRLAVRAKDSHRGGSAGPFRPHRDRPRRYFRSRGYAADAKTDRKNPDPGHGERS